MSRGRNRKADRRSEHAEPGSKVPVSDGGPGACDRLPGAINPTLVGLVCSYSVPGRRGDRNAKTGSLQWPAATRTPCPPFPASPSALR